MVAGSCICGAVRFDFTGEPVATIVCHCIPCRKCAGANGSTNLIIRPDQYRQIGDAPLRQHTRKGASGQDVTYDFCADCPTIILVRAVAMEGALILKTGLLDSVEDMERLAPKTEIYTERRIAPWCERSSDVELRPQA